METGKAREIFETLKGDIANGKYAVASPMPSERALMRRFGVARATVASALGELERADFVCRRRGSGTYPVVKKPVTFAVILPETERPFHAAIRTGLADCAKKSLGRRIFAVIGERRHSFLRRALRGGSIRYLAQNLRHVHIPSWSRLEEADAADLSALYGEADVSKVDRCVERRGHTDQSRRQTAQAVCSEGV